MRQLTKIFCVFCLVLIVTSLTAQERTIDQVKDEVIKLLSEGLVGFRGNDSTYRNNVRITNIKRKNIIYFYAVNLPDSGWAVISNEQRYPAIIGYSAKSSFDANFDNQPGALKCLLEHHMNMIDSLRESPSSYRERITSLTSLSNAGDEPLRTIDTILLMRDGDENRWNQQGNNSSSPNLSMVYNKFCPTWYTPEYGHTYVGCTAVALAQLAWYWRWPDYAIINDTILMTGTPSGPTRRHYYDWDKMPAKITNYTPSYQVDMVAGLLRDCGYASHMLYMPTYSEAGPIKLLNALENTYYFHVNRCFEYSWTNIGPIIQYELQLKRPVICQATNYDEVGDIHTFVIDGYNAYTNKYHINWGWGYDDNGTWDLGFNGYTSTRTFFTELYPDCSVREASVNSVDATIIESNKNVTLYSSNNVSLGQLVVNSNGHLNVSVGGTITLSSGFHAKNGSMVKLSPNYNCSTNSSSAPVCAIPRKALNNEYLIEPTMFSVAPNPAVDEITIHCDIPIEKIFVFNFNGQCILQTTQTRIDISHLPQGVYIIRASSEVGMMLQTKFIHQ